MVTPNITVATWYSILTVLFLGYTTFCAMQHKHYNDQGAIYTAILFGSLALGTFCIMMARLSGFHNIPQPIWFNLQRASYVGVLLGGWWLIDYRLAGCNGTGIPLRRLWRFWELFQERSYEK